MIAASLINRGLAVRDSLFRLQLNKRGGPRRCATAIATAMAMTVSLACSALYGEPAQATGPTDEPQAAASPSVQLTDNQLKSVAVSAAGEHAFPQERTAVGSIDFNENLAVQVFSPYQGKIIQAYGEVGDPVKKGQRLFTIDSPDLIQAESNLIGAAAALDQTSSALERAKRLYATQGIDQNDYETAVANQQTAEGALKAARDAVRVFGKSAAETDAIVASRKIDPVLVVLSPITGRITARVAQPGLLVQPGTAPAPYTVADVLTVWMLANVAETNIRYVRVGQKVNVSTMAYPGQVYEGKIAVIGATVDPNLHTLLIRSEILNPRRELLPGMFANFVIRIGDPITTTAVSLDTVVREADGTMTVWVPIDRNHFAQRVVKIGQQHDGFDQIVSGLKPGDMVVSKGALFLDNMLAPEEQD